MNFKEKIGKFFSEEEIEAAKGITTAEAGQEKKEGEYFEFKFSTGEVMRVTEDADGKAQAVLERDGKIMLDLREFFSPKAVKEFFTPKAVPELLKKGLMDEESKEFLDWHSLKNGAVVMGPMEDPRTILALLHELGHSYDEARMRDDVTRIRSLLGKFDPKVDRMEVKRKLHQKFNKALSGIERNAWAKALHFARSIKEKYGLDLLEVFADGEDLERYFSSALLTYRMEAALLRMDEYEASSTPIDEEEIKALRSYYDKGRLGTKNKENKE